VHFLQNIILITIKAYHSRSLRSIFTATTQYIDSIIDIDQSDILIFRYIDPSLFAISPGVDILCCVFVYITIFEVEKVEMEYFFTCGRGTEIFVTQELCEKFPGSKVKDGYLANYCWHATNLKQFEEDECMLVLLGLACYVIDMNSCFIYNIYHFMIVDYCV